MKKINLFAGALALLAVCAVSCEKNKGNVPDIDDIIEDGFYVAGPATGSELLQVDYKMATGLNEVDKTKRAGMYEKYVALEADKDFYLLLREAQVETRYSAGLEDFNTDGENDQPKVTLKRGVLQTGAAAPAMKVAESGLYHIVLDLNEAADLANAQIVVAPVQWGVRGAMNGWGFTAFETPEFNRTTMTYVMENVTVPSTGAFKFAYGGGWKIQLDDAGLVKANTNLGNDTDVAADLMPNDLVPNGKDINIARGIYTIKLTWKLAQGDIKNSFSAEMKQTGTLEAVDYSNCEMELVGSGVAEQEGSAPDTESGWNWGNVLPAGKPAVNGTVYTWTWNKAQLLADGFKIRTVAAKESGGVAAFDLGGAAVDLANSVAGIETPDGNIVAPAGTYDITLTIDGATDVKTIVIKPAAE